MKFASYVHGGKATFGALIDGQLVDLAGKIAGIDTLRAAIEAGALDKLTKMTEGTVPRVDPAKVTFLPVIPNPSKILCVGANFRDHAAESGMSEKASPGFFIRVDDTVIGHEAALEAPRVSPEFDFEGEIAAIIGRAGRHIPDGEALSFVAGYTCFMDGSVRDYQNRCVAAGKNFSASGSSGPYMVTADEVGDPSRLHLSTFLNGIEVQNCGLDEMIHSVPKTVAYLSTILTLRPGDVVAMGTPAGVGKARKPPLWMKAGDRLTVEIEKIGRLSNPVVAGT